MKIKNKTRCQWVKLNNPLYVNYHDEEWGRPVHDDNKHFEMLILEGAQAGLSWETILKRREDYRAAFKQFDPAKVAKIRDESLEKLLTSSQIIRNRLKVYSARNNAHVFLVIQKEFGSFDKYVWGFVDNKTLCNRPKTLQEVPTKTVQSDLLAKVLKKRGMRFVGSTIIYAYMQAIGMVDDHMHHCFRAKK